MEDIVVFQTRQGFIFVSKKCAIVTFAEKPQMNKKHFGDTKTLLPKSLLIGRDYQGTVVNRALPSLH